MPTVGDAELGIHWGAGRGSKGIGRDGLLAAVWGDVDATRQPAVVQGVPTPITKATVACVPTSSAGC